MNKEEFSLAMAYARSVFISECKHEGKLAEAAIKELADIHGYFGKAEVAAKGAGATMGDRIMLRLVTGLLWRTLRARTQATEVMQ